MEARGPIAKPLQLLVDLLAASSSFRARAGATTDDEARKRLHWPHLAVEIWEVERPCAVIMQAKGSPKARWKASGGRNLLRWSGQLDVLIADNDRFPDDLQESQIDFETYLGCVMDDVRRYAAEDDKLAVSAIDVVEPAAYSNLIDLPSVTPFWIAKFRVDWE
jgi:hypothetical protein